MTAIEIATNLVDHCKKYPSFLLVEETLKRLVTQNIDTFGDEWITLIEVYELIGDKIDNNIICMDMIEFIYKEKEGKYYYEIKAQLECEKCDIYQHENRDCNGCENYFIVGIS